MISNLVYLGFLHVHVSQRESARWFSVSQRGTFQRFVDFAIIIIILEECIMKSIVRLLKNVRYNYNNVIRNRKYKKIVIFHRDWKSDRCLTSRNKEIRFVLLKGIIFHVKIRDNRNG